MRSINNLIKYTLAIPALLLLSGAAWAGTTITYQGQLQDSGGPHSGSVDMVFELFDAETGGSSVGSAVIAGNVAVEDGLFQVELDFGGQPYQDGLYLEIEVDGDTLSPRQPITAAPLAVRSLSGNEGPPGPEGPQGPEGPPGDSHWTVSGNNIFFTGGHVAIGTDNSGGNRLRVQGSFVSGQDSNIASGNRSAVVGGRSNEASASDTFVGGGFGNQASGSRSAVVGGGGSSASSSNQASGDNSVIAGGFDNRVTGNQSFIGGGQDHFTGAIRSAIVGGHDNSITVGTNSVIAGGFDNFIFSTNSFIGGGSGNTAGGENSFAAGHDARALHDNSFVWSDGSSPDGVETTAEGQFVVGAAGAVRFFSGDSRSTGVELAPGGSGWLAISDRDAKMAIEDVDPAEVLDRVMQMPVSEFSYKSQDESIRHMGPMAQDFHALFELGEDELRISAMNLAGISLAAIQGLKAKNAEQQMEITALRTEYREEVAALNAEITELRVLADRAADAEARLAALEALLLDDRQVAGR